MKIIDEGKFVRVCNESQSMAQACAVLEMHFNTFKKYALRFGCYRPNQGLRGGKRNKKRRGAYPLDEILRGKYPQYQTNQLRKRLFSAGVKKRCCEICGILEWQGKPLSLELDHIDGNSRNHRLDNLRVVCPNCHSQTPTFRSKNRKHC